MKIIKGKIPISTLVFEGAFVRDNIQRLLEPSKQVCQSVWRRPGPNELATKRLWPAWSEMLTKTPARITCNLIYPWWFPGAILFLFCGKKTWLQRTNKNTHVVSVQHHTVAVSCLEIWNRKFNLAGHEFRRTASPLGFLGRTNISPRWICDFWIIHFSA